MIFPVLPYCYSTSIINSLIIVGVGPVTILNRNPAEFDSFIAAVQALSANGGGDSPEFALNGMLQGLQATQVINGVTIDLMTAGSQMIVLTDARSLRPEITDTVIAEANMRGVCIHFFISSSDVAVSDGIYPRIASETSGVLVQSFTNFQLANFIADTAVTPCGFINVQSTGGSSPLETFDISTVSVLLQLSIGAATGATVTITRPDSSFVNIVASQGFVVFSENNPQAGIWSVSVSTGTIEVSEITRTVVDTTFVYVSEGSNEVTLTPPTIQNCKLYTLEKYSCRGPSISSQYDHDN